MASSLSSASSLLEQLDVLGPLLHHGGDGFAADAEVRLDEPGDLARTGQHRLDLQAGQRLQLVEGVDVEGIAGGDDQGAVLARQRHEGAAMDQLERHRLERFRLDRHLGQIDQLHAELFGQGGEDVLLLGEALLDEELVERLGRSGGLGLGDARQVRFGEQALLDQPMRELHASSRGVLAVEVRGWGGCGTASRASLVVLLKDLTPQNL